MRMGDMLTYAALGALTGAAAAAGLWAIFSTVLDRQFARAGASMMQQAEAQLRRELEQRIPPMVSQAMDQKFREVGLTRETGQRISAVLQLADRAGLIGLRR